MWITFDIEQADAADRKLVQETGDAFVAAYAENWDGGAECIAALHAHFIEQYMKWTMRDMMANQSDTMRISRRQGMCKAYVEQATT